MYDEQHDFSAYHPHYTYTFEGFNTPPFKRNDPFNVTKPMEINTISDLIVKRPMLAPNVMRLYKEDIKVVRSRNGKRLRIQHPYLAQKTGYVVFEYHDIPDSQDTKSIFSAFVILGDLHTNGNAILKTCKVPFIMYMQPDGWLTEHVGLVRSK